MKKKNVSGFAVLGMLLFVVLVAVIAGAAYYVASKQNKTTGDKQAVSTSTTSNSSELEYKNTEFGFKFSYPRSWGSADFQATPGLKGESGGMTFKNESHYGLNFVSKDYERAGIGGGCLVIVAQNEFEAFKSEADNTGFIDAKINEPTFSMMYGGSDFLATQDNGCPAIMIARKKIENNPKITNIELRHWIDNKFKGQSDIIDYTKNPTTYFPQADQDTFLKVARSMTAL